MTRYQEIAAEFYGNRLLFGSSEHPGIVAVEIGPQKAEIFRRVDDKLVREQHAAQFFVLLGHPSLLSFLDAPHSIRELEGDFALRYLATFDTPAALEAAKRHLRKVAAGGSEIPYFVLTDPVEQFLMLTGMTFFVGLEFAQLRRLQIDVEACISAGFEFPSGAREGDRIAAIAVTDSSGFERVLLGSEMDEKAMLEQLVAIIRERDPDVIEGHNLFRFGLDYLQARARRNRVALKLGRDGSLIKSRSSRMQIAERTIAYRRFDIYGRSVVDTWMLAQHYDISSRELEGFALAEIERHFKLAHAGRIYIEPERVSDCLANDPAALREATLDNARQVAKLAEMLSLSYFVQAQIFPYSYQNVILRGNATKIDSLLLRAYLAEHHGVPIPGEPFAFAGGHTEVRRLGVAHQVAHCDVTSLYPSLMLQFGLGPGADRLRVFLKMLEQLRNFRVQAKTALREMAGSERRHMEALQQTFKILVNSFYGYLGFSMGHFNDYAQAQDVTRRGRELIQRAMVELEARGAQVIETDTDGIYFVAPEGCAGEREQEMLLDSIAGALPEGIKLEIDGRYPAMFSYKMKNYVLIDESGELTIRGSGLKSRGLERFQRRFMEEMFRLLLEDRRAEIRGLLEAYKDRIAAHQMPIRELMKTDTLQDSLEVYRQKISGKRRNVAAAYELALKASRPYNSGDQISYYVTGKGLRVKVNAAAKMVAEHDPAHPDENVEYYQAKLDELYAKFKPYLDRPGLFDAAALVPPEEMVQEELIAQPAAESDTD
ncbi:MAG TPA: DNA polymerase domain-containing protein [Candidatus Binataceae bacterium]|jgi:DNA polymerase I|nr:DNA polymerase domain-containing protein [Candidatus Binataceae bacterium]